MTIKTRITLYIAGVGFIASLLFSAVVFYELIEQPFDLLDTVLKEEANWAVEIHTAGNVDPEAPPKLSTDSAPYAYWTEIYEQATGKLIYQSGLAKAVSLPRVEPGGRSTATIPFSSNTLNLDRDNDGTIFFRIRSFLISTGGKSFFVQIARPMEKLEEEIQELIMGVLSGLVFCTLLLIVVSRHMAGKVLRPIGEMRDLAREIGEKNLDRRIPTGGGQDELSQLARTINQMLDRLQYSFAKQREFLFATSHELKTPLTTLRLAADEISRHDAETLPPCVQDNLPRLQYQALRMERLVKDLLNLSALETVSTIHPKPLQLNEILLPLAEEYRFLADARGIRMGIRISPMMMISGDIDMLRRAFSNILDNAIKYNMDDGWIELSGEILADNVRVIVANTGPGVSDAEIPRVFDQFFRAEKSRSSEHGGSGLGLSIVKRIMELHNGRVLFESRENGWTRVTVFLPNFRKNVLE